MLSSTSSDRLCCDSLDFPPWQEVGRRPPNVFRNMYGLILTSGQSLSNWSGGFIIAKNTWARLSRVRVGRLRVHMITIPINPYMWRITASVWVGRQPPPFSPGFRSTDAQASFQITVPRMWDAQWYVCMEINSVRTINYSVLGYALLFQSLLSMLDYLRYNQKRSSRSFSWLFRLSFNAYQFCWGFLRALTHHLPMMRSLCNFFDKRSASHCSHCVWGFQGPMIGHPTWIDCIFWRSGRNCGPKITFSSTQLKLYLGAGSLGKFLWQALLLVDCDAKSRYYYLTQPQSWGLQLCNGIRVYSIMDNAPAGLGMGCYIVCILWKEHSSHRPIQLFLRTCVTFKLLLWLYLCVVSARS